MCWGYNPLSPPRNNPSKLGLGVPGPLVGIIPSSHHASLLAHVTPATFHSVFTDVAEEQTAKSLESLRQAESSGSDPAPGSPTSSAGEPAGGTSAAAKLNAADADLPERHSHRRVKPVRGFTCSASGEMLPLGPQVEFKIIDYGVAIFDERLAESTGGTEYKGVLQRIKHVVAAKEVVFPSREGTHPGINRTVPLQTSTGAVGRASHAWHLLPTKLKNKFRVKQTPVGAFPVVSDESFTEAPAGVALGASKRIPRLNNATRRLMKESGFGEGVVWMGWLGVGLPTWSRQGRVWRLAPEGFARFVAWNCQGTQRAACHASAGITCN